MATDDSQPSWPQRFLAEALGGQEPRWHGWSSTDLPGLQLHVGHLPGRKSACLYVIDGSLWVLAYFRTEDDARATLALLDRLMP